MAMQTEVKFKQLYAGAGEAAGPGASVAPPSVAPRRRHGATLIDLFVGLAIRGALALQFFAWSRVNAEPVSDPLNWRAWMVPDPGLVQASSVWLLGQVDPRMAAFGLLVIATVMAVLLGLGFMARLAGLLVVFGAIWHVVVVLPSAWPQTLIYGVLGLYLVLRGAGPASLDWALARLSRLG